MALYYVGLTFILTGLLVIVYKPVWIELHEQLFLNKILAAHSRFIVDVNILPYSDPYHWTRSALHYWQLVGKTNVCSI